MANTPRKRKTEDALWEQHRPFLEELFVTEGKTTQQVMKIMAAAPLSFVRSYVYKFPIAISCFICSSFPTR